MKDNSGKELSEAQVYLERAKRARELQKKAPVTLVGGVEPVRQKVIIKKLEEAYKKKGLDFHFMAAGKADSNSLADKGYEPGILDGEWMEYEGDKYWGIPKEMYNQRMESNANRSKRRVGMDNPEFKNANESSISDKKGKLVVTTTGAADAELLLNND